MLKWIIGLCALSAITVFAPQGDAVKDAFSAFFRECPYAPEGTRLLDVSVDDGTVVVDVSKEIMNYGGTEWEIQLLAEMKEAARPFADRITLLIEGQPSLLPEGTEISNLPVE